MGSLEFPPPGGPYVQIRGGKADVHPREMASPLGYGTANKVATAWAVATDSALALFPDAQLETSALAAPWALGCGAAGIAGADVVAGGAVVVAGAVVVVVAGATALVGAVAGTVVGTDALEVLHPVASTPTTATTANARRNRVRRGVMFPL